MRRELRKLWDREFRWECYQEQSAVVCESLGRGIKILLPTDSEVAHDIFMRRFESAEIWFITAFLRRGETVVDVGANIGLHTLHAARRVGHSGRVYAFEPCPVPFDYLSKSIQLNRMWHVTCVRAALSNAAGTATLNVPDKAGLDAFSSLAHEVSPSPDAHRIEVPTLTLDQYSVEQDLVGKVVLMKLDVEGWEEHVLAGGREMLGRPDAPTLLVEFTDNCAQNAGSSCQALYRALEELGYHLFRIKMPDRTILPDPIRQSYPFMNLVATKNHEAVKRRLGGT